MTNFEKWKAYMDWAISPDIYIDFGFYSLVSAFLQRRVWSGPEHSPLYPNTYNILVGEPGLGKGLVIKEYTRFLKHHTLKDPRERKQSQKLDEVSAKMAEIQQKEEYREAQEREDGIAKKNKWFEKPLLIPVAADAITYEALITEMANSKRLINFPDIDKETGNPKLGLYTHSSMSFALEEMSSLFRKKTEDLIRFLLQAYDCGDYNYQTVHRGKDRIRACCLNIFAGTTPGFMEDALNDAIIAEGFSSRTFFIFAASNRKTALRFPELTSEQLQYRKELLEHFEKLAHLYGAVRYTDEAWSFLEEWWKKAQITRPNISSKLNPYYSRKNIHVQKVAMSIHFGESTEMEIGVDTFKRALEVLATIEKKMHYCLGLDKTNPLALCSRKIETFIAKNTGGFTFRELKAEFFNSLPGRNPSEDLQIILEHLMFVGSVHSEMRENKNTKEQLLYYYPKTQSDI